jgi:hypothetical protein
MAGYSGLKIEWADAINSDLAMAPEIKSLNDPAPVMPDADGAYPLPIPGKHKVM